MLLFLFSAAAPKSVRFPSNANTFTSFASSLFLSPSSMNTLSSSAVVVVFIFFFFCSFLNAFISAFKSLSGVSFVRFFLAIVV